AMRASVDEVGSSAAEEGIDCSFHKGGTLLAARNAAQLQRLRAEVDRARELGLGEEDLKLLGREEARSVVRMKGMLGATYTPHCAALDPARLARGLADAVVRHGVAVYEGTPVTAIAGAGAGGNSGARRPSVATPGGRVRADTVVVAVEGWTAALAGRRRALLPVYSLMVATEPLSADFWAETGLDRREVFSDNRHLVVYGQRTSDGRSAFGGRGAPYHFGSAVRPSFDRAPAVHRSLVRTLVELFPSLAGARITHRWGGPLGVPRDWFSSVGLDRASGIAWAGGYVGDGVSTSNLAGRTLADLVLGHDSELVHLPWVGHRSPKWEPEPLRWLGVNLALSATRLADRNELSGGTPSRLGMRLKRLLGS
ncbi:MAG: NAD(P)/FAD-dependent oxidoreductase, partial [Acidimicrobiales bacterium]